MIGYGSVASAALSAKMLGHSCPHLVLTDLDGPKRRCDKLLFNSIFICINDDAVMVWHSIVVFNMRARSGRIN